MYAADPPRDPPWGCMGRETPFCFWSKERKKENRQPKGGMGGRRTVHRHHTGLLEQAADQMSITPFLFSALADEEYDKIAPVIACTLPALTDSIPERKRKELAGEVTRELQVVGNAASIAIGTWVRSNDKFKAPDFLELSHDFPVPTRHV